MASGASGSQATETVTLVPDPFLQVAEVTTSVPMAIKCPCTIISSCAGHPTGFDCAEPAGCCHCSAGAPALRRCVGTPS
jgi:hypothetical protein